MSEDYIKTPQGWVKREKHFRLRGYDYSSAGCYFVTLVTQNREKLFGEINDGKMILNEIGLMIQKFWILMGTVVGSSLVDEPTPDNWETGMPIKDMPTEFFMKSKILLDQFIIMPDHLHAIIILEESGKLTLGEIIGAFKSLTTNEYIAQVKLGNWKKFEKRIWQNRFHDRIIRTEIEYKNIREYILNNPINWEIQDSH